MPDRPPNIIITGTGLLAFAGVTTVIWMSTVISGYAELSTRADQLLADRPARPPTSNVFRPLTVHVTFGTFFGTRPSTSRSKSSTISGPALLPPHVGARDLLAVLERQTSGRFGIRIRRRLVVVGVVGRRLVAARTGTQRLDAELLHHVLVIRGGRGRVGVCGGPAGAAVCAAAVVGGVCAGGCCPVTPAVSPHISIPAARTADGLTTDRIARLIALSFILRLACTCARSGHAKRRTREPANREPRTARRILPPNQHEVDAAHHNERWNTHSVRPCESLNSTIATIIAS